MQNRARRRGLSGGHAQASSEKFRTMLHSPSRDGATWAARLVLRRRSVFGRPASRRTTRRSPAHCPASPASRSWSRWTTPSATAARPVWNVFPFEGRLLDRREGARSRPWRRCSLDCLIVDNHLPKRRLAPRLYVLWHGYGWRVDDLSTMKRELVELVGPVDAQNDRISAGTRSGRSIAAIASSTPASRRRT